jgi:hypothetical protein
VIKVKDMYFKYTALSPIIQSQPKISNSGPKKGNETQQRTMTFLRIKADEKGKETVKLPVISGSSRRGIHRRNFINHVLREIELMQGWQYSREVKSDTLLTFLSGGDLGKGSKSVNPSIQGYIDIYNKLPFFGLFGGVFESTFFQGRLSSGIAIPLTNTTYPLTIAEGSPFTSESDVADDELLQYDPEKVHGYVRSTIRGVLPSEGFEKFLDHFRPETTIMEAVEKDCAGMEIGDPIPPLPTLLALIKKKGNEEVDKLGKYLDAKKTDKGYDPEDIIKKIRKYSTNQMLFFLSNCIPAGTCLFAHDYLQPGYGDDDLMEACWHKYIEMMMNRPYMGGMASKGYGMTKVEILTRDGKKFEDISRAKDFDAWLKDNKDQIAHDVINMKKILCS